MPESTVADDKGRRYPADPPRIEEIISIMREAGHRPHGLRVRGLIVVLWRAGLRIGEALTLAEVDLERLAAHASSAGARAVSAERLGWTPGVGSSFVPGLSFGAIYRRGRCSAR